MKTRSAYRTADSSDRTDVRLESEQEERRTPMKKHGGNLLGHITIGRQAKDLESSEE
jgi:hypothetical protein